MNEDASKLDLLILSYCHDHLVWLPVLLRDDMDEALNMPHHCLGRDLLFEELRMLVERGWLEVHHVPRASISRRDRQALQEAGWVEDSDVPEDATVTGDQAVRLLEDARHSMLNLSARIRLGLTRDGGQAWEKFARPRWYLFVNHDGPVVIDGRVHLIIRTVTRRMAMFVSEMLLEWGWPMRPKPLHKISGLDSVEALYWKRFSKGYQILIDLQAGPGTPVAEAYRAGIVGVDNAAANITNYACSLWSTEFRTKLHEIRLSPRRW